VTLVDGVDQVGNDFCVALAFETVASIQQDLTQGLLVVQTAVVHHSHTCRAVERGLWAMADVGQSLGHEQAAQQGLLAGVGQAGTTLQALQGLIDIMGLPLGYPCCPALAVQVRGQIFVVLLAIHRHAAGVVAGLIQML
jgi:hypothetical protein